MRLQRRCATRGITNLHPGSRPETSSRGGGIPKLDGGGSDAPKAGVFDPLLNARMLGMFHADISRTQPPESCAHLVPAHATRPRQRNRPRTDSPKPASESHIDAQPASSSGARLGALPLRPSPPLVPMTALALVCATLADGGDDLPRTCTTPRQSVAANARGAGRSARTSSPPRSSSTPLVDRATRVASTCHTHDTWEGAAVGRRPKSDHRGVRRATAARKAACELRGTRGCSKQGYGPTQRLDR